MTKFPAIPRCSNWPARLNSAVTMIPMTCQRRGCHDLSQEKLGLTVTHQSNLIDFFNIACAGFSTVV